MERKPQYRILIVDDHDDNIELLRARLEARGYEVQGANDGQAALDTVDRWCPDLILLDVMMPKMDGIEVVRRLKAKTDRKELPFHSGHHADRARLHREQGGGARRRR